MKTAQILALALFFTITHANAQEQLGLRLDNYSGINSAILNPAGPSTSPFSWDVNLAEGAFFFDNNYGFLRQTRLTDLLQNIENKNLYNAADLDDDSVLPPNSLVLDYYNDNRERYATALVSITGPSFYVRINEKHSIGLITRARFMTSGRGIVNDLSYYIYDAQPFLDDFKVDPFRLGGMGWAELGLNYVYTKETTNGQLAFGVTAKYLQGYEAAYFQNESAFQLTKLSPDSIGGTALNFDFGFTTSNLNTDDYQLQRNGVGAALDLGLVYAFGDAEEGYKWRIGFSVLDVGFINYNLAAERHRVDTDLETAINTAEYQDLEDITDFDDVANLFSDQIFNDPNASLQSQSFQMWLPSSISAQVDYSINRNFYLNGTLVQGFPMGGSALQRGSLLAFSPRFESRWFGASMPLSMYNWQKVNLGLSLRLGFITLGTDNLLSIIQSDDFSGSDAYFAIKINPFGIGKSEGGAFSSGWKGYNKAGKGKVKCYEF